MIEEVREEDWAGEGGGVENGEGENGGGCGRAEMGMAGTFVDTKVGDSSCRSGSSMGKSVGALYGTSWI